MKNKKKTFLLIEILLACIVLLVAYFMVWEQDSDSRGKISVLLQNPDASRWSAFKYGIKMAAEDHEVEVSFVPMEKSPSMSTLKKIMKQEIKRGADALVIQPSCGAGAEDTLLEIKRQIPILLIEPVEAKQDQKSNKFPQILVDEKAMGENLAEELLKDYNGNISGKRIGIFYKGMRSAAIQLRIKGVTEILEAAGGEIVWESQYLEREERVNFVIALDDISLVEAGEKSAERDLHGALVYGIGNSTEAIYYLDIGSVECMVVPDDFYHGYQSITQIMQIMSHSFKRLQTPEISHKAFRSKDLFLDENQETLFTMSQ